MGGTGAGRRTDFVVTLCLTFGLTFFLRFMAPIQPESSTDSASQSSAPGKSASSALPEVDDEQRPKPFVTGHNGVVAFVIGVLCFILIALDRTELLPFIHPGVLTLYQLFVFLSAFGLLLGVANVLIIHLRRIAIGEPEWGFSLALIATALATLLAGLLHANGVAGPIVEWIFDALLAPGQATLYAVIIFFMAAAAYRYLRFTVPGGAWMLLGALLMLLVQMPASHNFLPSLTGEWMAWLLQSPIMATLRGAILGSTLALLLVGVRYLLGREQP